VSVQAHGSGGVGEDPHASPARSAAMIRLTSWAGSTLIASPSRRSGLREMSHVLRTSQTSASPALLACNALGNPLQDRLIRSRPARLLVRHERQGTPTCLLMREAQNRIRTQVGLLIREAWAPGRRTIRDLGQADAGECQTSQSAAWRSTGLLLGWGRDCAGVGHHLPGLRSPDAGVDAGERVPVLLPVPWMRRDASPA